MKRPTKKVHMKMKIERQIFRISLPKILLDSSVVEVNIESYVLI